AMSAAPLQGTGPAAPVIPFTHQKGLHLVAASEPDRAAPRREDAALHRLQLQVENSADRLLVQRIEDHDLVQPVHELRREFAPRGFYADLFQTRVDLLRAHRSLRE